MAKYFICPHAEGTPNCAIYDNWLKHGHSQREDIIELDEGRYKCIALESLLENLSKGAVIEPSSAIRKRIFNYESLGCSHIELLNTLIL